MFCSRDTMLYTSQAISGFDPRAIPGCVLWLDGGDNATMNSTTAVTLWNDKSGSGNTMTGTGTWSGGRMVFNGSTNAFSNTTFVFPSSNYSLFAVYSNTTAPASTAYMNVVYGSNGYPMVGVYDSTQYVTARSVVGNTGALTTSAPGGWVAQIGGAGNEVGNGIAVDALGNVFVSGQRSTAQPIVCNANGTVATTTLASTGGGDDAFIVKYSSDGTVAWAAQIGGGVNDYGGTIATDPSGNVIAIGSHSSGPLTLYNANGATGGTLTTAGGYDTYVAKYSTSGSVVWVAQIGGTSTDFGNGVTTDASGNVFITGQYAAALSASNATIIGGVGATLAFTGGSYDCFLVKYTSTGTVAWAAQIASTASDAGRGVATDASGNVFVTGTYGAALTLYSAGGATSNTLPLANNTNGFLAKYSPTGSILWSAQIVGTDAVGTGTATDASGNVFVSGYYTSTLTLSNATIIGGVGATVTNSGGYDGFIAKYTSTGTLVWASHIGGSATDTALGVATDSSGNVFITGYYNSTLTLYNKDGTTASTLTNAGGADGFVAKYTSTGFLVWAARISGGGSIDQGNAIAVDTAGNAVVTGYNNAAVTLYNSDGTTGVTSSFGGIQDMFIAKYSPAGFITSGPVPASSNVMVSATYPSPTALTPFTNGVSMTALAGTTLATTGIYVGGPSNYFNGSVSEVLVFNNTLGSTQRQSVEGYLARKWGLQTLMPTIHPFRSLPPFSRQFSPLDIPGCALWLDGADAAMTSNITTGIWRDKSGNGCNTTSNAGGGAFSMGTINGLPAVTFPPASSAKLTANVAVTVPATASSNAGFTLFFTGNWTSNASASARFWALSGTSIDFEFLALASGRAPVTGWTYSAPSGLFDLTIPYNTPFTYSTTFASTASGGISNWLNGAAGSNNSLPSSTATGYTSNFSIGNYPYAPAAAYSFTGQMGEFLIYSNALTNSQRLQVEGYLSAKWSIPNFGVFNPFGSVPGLVAWFDTYDASYTTTGNTVTKWQNKAEGVGSSSATTGSGTVSINQAYLNGKSSVRFPAGTNYLNSTVSFSTNLRSTFFVATVGASAASTFANVILIGNDTIGGQLYGYGNQLQLNKAGTSALTTAANNYFGSTSIVSITTTTGNTGIWVNGSNQTLIQNNITSTFWDTGSSTLSIGGFTGLTTSSNADIYELLHFDGTMTTFQRQQIEGYLAWKWGLQANLPATHPFVSAAPSAHPYKTLPPTVSQPAQYSEVSPGNWTYDWQPYLKQLARANSTGVTASFSSNALAGSASVNAYFGGVLAPNGKIYGNPLGDTTVGVIDPIANSFTKPVSGTAPANAYAGGVLAPNGKIYCIPHAATAIGLIDPISNTFSSNSVTGTAIAVSPAYCGGVLAPNGKIYCIPRVETSIGLIDPISNTFTKFGSASGYIGGVLGPNGKIYCIPNSSGTIGVIDPVTNTFTTFGSSISGYSGGVLAPNGKIYCIPNSATVVGVIDPTVTPNTFSTFGSATGYFGGVLGPNGKIYCTPYISANVGVIDPDGSSFTTLGTAPASGYPYVTSILAPNGNIYCMQFGSTSYGVISFTGLSQLPSSNYCLSAYANKF